MSPPPLCFLQPCERPNTPAALLTVVDHHVVEPEFDDPNIDPDAMALGAPPSP